MYQGIESIDLPGDSAKHTLTSFEWQDGVPTAKITTTFNGTAQVILQGTPTLYKANGTRTSYFDWRSGRLIKMIDDYTIVQTDSGGNVTLSGPGGGGPSGPPGYTPYRGPYSPGGGGSGGVGDSTAMKVLSTTQLTG